MKEERLDVSTPSIGVTAIWTQEELSGCDAVVYFSGYSYDSRRTRSTPDAVRILYLCEPLSVYPVHFCRGFWTPFDAVLTWNNRLAVAGGLLHELPVISYHYPFAAGHGVTRGANDALPDLLQRRKALCQIVGDKYSPMIGQLYSLRRAAARWFYRHGQMDMDVYGIPAMNVPNYKGGVDSKLDTFRLYRYALCFENLHHPFWSSGYVSEKIFDCMIADCVPVYYGASNIEKYIPENCFIDFRAFADFEALDAFLVALSDEDYLNYIKNIRAFLRKHHATYRYSCDRLYETVEKLVRSEQALPLGRPAGFFQIAGFREKGAYFVMVCGLRVYRFIHPLFSLLRRIGSWRNR